MKLRDVHKIIPFNKLFKLVFGFAIAIQLIIIITNHVSGYYVLDGLDHFFMRFLRGSILSMIATFFIVYPDLFVISYLNRIFSWKKKVFIRVSIQFMITVMLGIAASVLFSLTSNYITPYREGLPINMIYNAMIFSVCNVILMIILEGWIFFEKESTISNRSKLLEHQVSQLRFEVLKSQIDSHFMFNSLNVLSGLVDKDPEKAKLFIDEFSSIYRYVLDSIEKQVVTVEEELNFARSYISLQQMRYGENLLLDVDLRSELLKAYIPPLSLQVVMENACKHNQISPDHALTIRIYGNRDHLIIRNNLKTKISGVKKRGTGQENLIKRYTLLGTETPEFRMGTSSYTVTLPLITEEY